MRRQGPWRSLAQRYLSLPVNSSEFKHDGNYAEPFLAFVEGGNVVQHLFREVGFGGTMMILLERPDKRKGDLLADYCSKTEDR